MIEKEFRNLSIASKTIAHLFKFKKINYIVGQAKISSNKFWKNMIHKYHGIKKKVTLYENCKWSFILTNDKEITDLNLLNDDNFKDLLKYFYNRPIR